MSQTDCPDPAPQPPLPQRLEHASRSQGEPAAVLRLPLEIFPAGSDPLSPRAEAWWLWTFMAVGLAVRLVRYLLRFPLWEDEALLSANYLDRGYLGLLQPLGYLQVCPPLFLWCQLTVLKGLGFTEYTLRLIPFLCAMISVPLFRHVAGRLLHGTALVLVVGVFAVGYPMVRYTGEAKPYSSDLLLGLVMLGLAIEWLRRPGQRRWLWALAGLVGPAVGFSYPVVFVAGAVSLVVARVLWTSRGRGWRPWIAFNLVLSVSFAAVLVLSRTAVGEVNQRDMVDYWTFTFPPVTHPLRLIGWFVSTHAGGMLAYPFGGPHGGSTLSLACCLIGLAALARRRQGLLMALCLAPLGLNFAAAALHRFPYGGHPRMGLYLGSVFSMLVGLGVAELLAWAAARRKAISPAGAIRAPRWPPVRWLPRQHRTLGILLAALLALAAGIVLRDLAHPYHTPAMLRARAFARWFWLDVAHDCELVCLKADFLANLSPRTAKGGWTSLYLCNQRIYSPRHARGQEPDWDRISAEWPLRCVWYRSPSEQRDSRPLEAWLEQMQSEYVFVARDQYLLPDYDKAERQTWMVDSLEVFQFVPREGMVHGPPPMRLETCRAPGQRR
jgi:hypothetical protein